MLHDRPTPASFGLNFSENLEEAFSIMEILIPLGTLSCTVLQQFLCTFSKTLLYIALLMMATVGYTVLESLRVDEGEQRGDLESSDALIPPAEQHE